MSAAPTSTELAPREPRPLGIRRKPQLRLALGYRDMERKGAPVKTDFFIPKGNEAVVAKFKKVYGDKPRAIDIRLPGSLGGFLEIKHLAFAGGQADGGGVLKAVGKANFATEGTLGGPDILTVFDVVEGKLTVAEIEISGVDDPVCKKLGVQLTTTVAFGIPDVLGFGGICAITSRGKETTDTLWETAVDVYGSLGAAASMILRPKLILKESRMLTPQGQHVPLWVLDLYVPESVDEVKAAAREYRDLLPGRARFAREALYGPIAGELPSADSADWDLHPVEEAEVTSGGSPADAAETPETGGGSGQQVGAPVETGPSAGASAPDTDEPDTGEEPSQFQPPPDAQAAKDAADAAGRYAIETGKHKGKTIAQIAAEPKGSGWIAWAMKATDHAATPYAKSYARVYLPEVFQAAMVEIQTRAQVQS